MEDEQLAELLRAGHDVVIDAAGVLLSVDDLLSQYRPGDVAYVRDVQRRLVEFAAQLPGPDDGKDSPGVNIIL